jgi:xanthine dehydrogenase accessory factor
MDVYEELVRLRRSGQKAALATIVAARGSIPAYEGAKLLVREDGSMLGTVGGGCVEAEVWNAARQVLETEKPRKLTFNLAGDALDDSGLICGGELDVLVEPVLPLQVAYLFGGGHVSLAGFATVVVDDREQFANRERFPEADQVYAEEFEKIFPRLPVTGSSYIIICTRGHKDDMRVLRWAVTTPARYVGMIGSKRKAIEILEELEKEGLPRQQLERVHSPMGLEIGAITPEEIAVSVVAEMVAIRRGADVKQTITKSIFSAK